MGAYTCQFGKNHGTCRCRETHTIVCDKPEEHFKRATAFGLCYRLRYGKLGKRERHDAHDFWYTSWGGGHDLVAGWEPTKDNGDGTGWDSTEGHVRKYRCPGRS